MLPIALPRSCRRKCSRHRCELFLPASRLRILIPKPASFRCERLTCGLLLTRQFVRLLNACSRGEVSERFKEHAWKACVGETQPWVRIPPSPPFWSLNSDRLCFEHSHRPVRGPPASSQREASHLLRTPLWSFLPPRPGLQWLQKVAGGGHAARSCGTLLGCR